MYAVPQCAQCTSFKMNERELSEGDLSEGELVASDEEEEEDEMPLKQIFGDYAFGHNFSRSRSSTNAQLRV